MRASLHVLAGDVPWCVEHAEALDALRVMPSRSVDAVVTDPPSGIAFMGAAWDTDKGGRDTWIAWLAEVFAEIRRVAKPGAHALVWALPRTSHWTATGIENGGWEIRDRVAHLFGQGFPKSMAVDKAIDRMNGDARAPGVPGPYASRRPRDSTSAHVYSNGVGGACSAMLTSAASAASAAWEGWGTALKPACEDWWLARAPLAERSIAANVLAHGTGALAIDACRIAGVMPEIVSHGRPSAGVFGDGLGGGKYTGEMTARGRWPAHVVLSHAAECRRVGTRKIAGSNHAGGGGGGIFAPGDGVPVSPGKAGPDGFETVEAWACSPDCPVRMLDEQSGEPDEGGASRFFYTAKPSTGEREFGCDDLEAVAAPEVNGRDPASAGAQNPRAGAARSSGAPVYGCTACGRRLHGGQQASPCEAGGAHVLEVVDTMPLRRNVHITVKSIALMRWLVRLVCPPGGLVLDPFAGSGTTIVAARREGMRAIGLERDERYATIARARVARWEVVRPDLDDGKAPAEAAANEVDARQLGLFAGARP